LCAPDPTPIPP